MRRDVILVLVIALAALGIRTYPAWNTVFHQAGVSFLETDAWYHVRLVENQVRNFPWRVTRDPYAAAGGQFVPIAPLFDALTSSAILVTFGRDATTDEVERVAALMPPIFGALTVIATWAFARVLFDRRAALIAAGLVAILPGHFMDRTMLGFVDHHALESLLAMCVLASFAFAVAQREPQHVNVSMARAVPAGIALGLYLLAWSSGAYLLGIVGAWLTFCVLLTPRAEDLRRPASLIVIASVIALLLVLCFQHPGMLRYGSQVFGLGGLAVAASAIAAVAARTHARPSMATLVAVLLVVVVAAVVIVAIFARDVVDGAIVDLGRLAPDPARMGVLEARPLFLYGGNWDWMQPWAFFRTGAVIGVVGIILFAARLWRRRSPADLLLWVFAIVTLLSTIGQNRFGYYFVPACAVLGGWMAMELLDWGGVAQAGGKQPPPRSRFPMARDLAIVAIAGGMFAPNVAPAVLLAARTASFPNYWRDAMQWLRANTPAPFPQHGGDDYYHARYPDSGVPGPGYTVMTWWDQGYWVVQQARRVPVANPTQERAPNAAFFYTATSEDEALAIAASERTRYVVADFELPYRRAANGSIMGRFQTILDWTGKPHQPFYEVAYKRERGQWVPTWIFHESYYRSMAFRLSVLGASAAVPSKSTSVAIFADRVDQNGMPFRELVSVETLATFEEATRAREAAGAGAVLIGLDPWQSAFPLDALRSFVQVHAVRTPEQQPAETPWVRIFDVR